MPCALWEAGGRLGAVDVDADEVVEGRRSSVGGSGFVFVRWRMGLGGGLGGGDVCEVSVFRRGAVGACCCGCWCIPDEFREWVVVGGMAAAIQVRWHTRQG